MPRYPRIQTIVEYFFQILDRTIAAEPYRAAVIQATIHNLQEPLPGKVGFCVTAQNIIDHHDIRSPVLFDDPRETLIDLSSISQGIRHCCPSGKDDTVTAGDSVPAQSIQGVSLAGSNIPPQIQPSIGPPRQFVSQGPGQPRQPGPLIRQGDNRVDRPMNLAGRPLSIFPDRRLTLAGPA
jgi:hypothetical protein